jgi:hypothetical protein
MGADGRRAVDAGVSCVRNANFVLIKTKLPRLFSLQRMTIGPLTLVLVTAAVAVR